MDPPLPPPPSAAEVRRPPQSPLPRLEAPRPSIHRRPHRLPHLPSKGPSRLPLLREENRRQAPLLLPLQRPQHCRLPLAPPPRRCPLPCPRDRSRFVQRQGRGATTSEGEFDRACRVASQRERVSRCRKRADELERRIRKKATLLSRPKRINVARKIKDEKERLEVELAHINGKLGEFKVAMESILSYLKEGKDRVLQMGELDLFKFGRDMDLRCLVRIQSIVARECSV